MTLALPGIDTLPPQSMRRTALSQWFTPMDIALRMARWAGNVGGRVLEPSAGNGALVRAWASRAYQREEDLGYDDSECSGVDAIDIDADLAREHGWECANYLGRGAPAERYGLALMNPPYEDGLDGAFLAKTMDECDRVIALVRLAALAGSGRHTSVWSRVEGNVDGWWMPGLAIFSSRPVFDGPPDASGSAKSDFVCVKLSRVGEPGRTAVEWW